jgi:predicted NBD/HSP70 family sugar kinase
MANAEVMPNDVIGPGLLLSLIRERPSTRTELVERTGLARSTLAPRLEVLEGLGLITTRSGPSTGGRPAARLVFNPAAGLVAAAHVDHTHCWFAITDLAGASVAEGDEDIDMSTGPQTIVTWLVERWDTLLERAGRSRTDIWGCGIGVAGPVEFHSGMMVRPPTLPEWDRFPLADTIRSQLGAPTLVDNDVNVMALGEHVARPEARDLIFVWVGFGIGAGIVSDGRIHRGARGIAGDIAHIPVAVGEGAVCACGNVGCLGMVASGSAIAARLTAGGLAASGARDVAEHVRAGIPEAVAAVREAGRATGRVLSGLVTALNPSVVAVGGPIAEAGEHLLAGIREEIYGRSTAIATEELRIVAAQDATRAGIVGASRMTIDRLLDPDAVDRGLLERARGTVAAATA